MIAINNAAALRTLITHEPDKRVTALDAADTLGGDTILQLPPICQQANTYILNRRRHRHLNKKVVLVVRNRLDQQPARKKQDRKYKTKPSDF